MYNKNQFFYNTHDNYKNINKSTGKKMNTRNPCVCTIKVQAKKWSWTYGRTYSGSFYWPCGLRNLFLITVISLWDRNQTGNMLVNFLFRKRISMLTGLKVSSLVRKCVFYRPELTGKWAIHGTEIKFLKFKTETYQRIELKE